MVAIVDIGTLIVRTPQVAGGRPCIAGRRMTVQNLVMDSQASLSPQDILTEYPHLSLAQVYAALAYYYANCCKVVSGYWRWAIYNVDIIYKN